MLRLHTRIDCTQAGVPHYIHLARRTLRPCHSLLDVAMSAPKKPIQLLPYATYVHLSSSLPPEKIQQDAAAQDVIIEHKGPVGELEGEHVFEVLDGRRTSIAGDSLVGRDVVETAVLRLKGTDGIKDAKVLEQKQRAKR